MQNKFKLKLQGTWVGVMNIIIVLLVIATFVEGAVLVRSFSEELDRGFEEESFFYRLQDESFGIVRLFHTNDVLSVNQGEEMQKYYCAARYYEAASYYKVFSESGDTLRAQRYLEKMNEAAGQLEELDSIPAQVNEWLGID